MASKTIKFSIPDYLYDGIKDFLETRNWFCSEARVEDYFKACAINRMIEVGVLDEFGMPIPVPKLDFSKITTGIPISSLREV